MADEKDKKEDAIQDENASNEPQNVADLSVPKIVVALHQTAISKSDAKSKGARLVNSAIEEKNGTSNIDSSGEHIISVLPIDEKTTLEKKTAIEILKTYVQWFVGPDLASKVNDSTVKSLTEAPGYEKTKEEQKEVKEVKESSNKFISFKQFLLEKDPTVPGEDPEGDTQEDIDARNEATDAAVEDDDTGKKDDAKQSDIKQSDKASESNDESEESKTGYYIPYSLKVEGLPQNGLKDSMKKFAKTFFDDMKIKFTGLFGGSDSFTVKDIKKSLRSTFGPIDPDELVNSLQARIEKMYPNTNRPSVNVQDKTTLIDDLGKQINSAQKKLINTADYSLFIKVNEDDPKKPILNTRIVADIVTSSIKGLFKKFKNKITKNDVIFISDYKDTHDDAEAIRKIYISVPSPDQLQTAITKARDANTAYTSIEKLIEKINKDPQYKNVNRAVKCLQVWQNYVDAWNKAGENEKTRTGKTGKTKDEYFADFQKKYKEVFNATKDKSIKSTLNESLDIINSINDNVYQLLIEALIPEAEKTDTTEQISEIDSETVKQQIKKIFKVFNLDANLNVVVGTVDEIKNKLKYYDTSSIKYDNFKNAVIITANENSLNESLSNDSIKASILDILFEDDKNVNEKTKNNDEEKETTSENTQEKQEKKQEEFEKKLDEKRKNIYSAIQQAFAELDPPIKNYSSELFVIKMKSLDNVKEPIKESYNFLLENNETNKIQEKFQSKLIAISNDNQNKPGKFYIPKNAVDSVDNIKNWLDKVGLVDSSFDEYSKDFQYAASVVVKMPDEDGKKASKGYGKFNKSNVVDLLKKSIDNLDSNISCVEYEKTANDKFTWNKTKIPAKCQVWVAFFNLKENSSGSDLNPASNPGADTNSNPNPNLGISYKDTIAFVLPFGEQKVKQPNIKVNDVDIKDESSGKQDAYIIPMVGLKYDDTEYENTNL